VRPRISETAKEGLSYVAFRPKPYNEPVDAGIIEIDFPAKTIVSNRNGDYVCHRGVRDTWGYTGPHLDVGRVGRFHVPDRWTIIDRYFFGRPVKIGEISIGSWSGDSGRELSGIENWDTT